MISKAYRKILEISSVFPPRATVDATFVPWLWASVNMGRGTEIISASKLKLTLPRIAALRLHFGR
ncbi:hypothetical protein GGQ72_001667 [Rhizobium rhizoryzae]|uniref:Uncharacterized protein n=1 Tax=Rhizobium rhizoryzae TaxID=451876 RepID=A0A7W6LH22_9HYPH|nr:hypothetical protein [Rhizobium rhizoryzae]